MTVRRLPPLNAVRAFEAAARHRSMSQAATELRVTPGAVSRHVKDLEARMGRLLFVRAAHGLELTASGETLFHATREALDLIAAGAGSAVRNQPRRLSIGVYGLFASRMLLPLWPRLESDLPRITVDLHTSSDPLDLLPGRYSAVIAVGDSRARKGMLMRPLVPITTVAVCAPVLLGKGLPDFNHIPLLHARPRPDDWRRWLDHAGYPALPVQQGCTFESIALALEAAAMGLGAAIAIEALIGSDLATGKIVIAHPARRPTRRHFVLQAEARHARDPDLLAFADWLEARLSSHAPASRRTSPRRHGAAQRS